MKYKVPDEKQFNDMLHMIVGPDAEAKACDPLDASSITHTAVYIDDEDQPVASCACAMPTAAALGCALSKIPPGGAEGMVEDNELTAMASDNLYEVMNILSSLLMSDSTQHLRLEKIEAGGDARYADGEGEASYSLDLGPYGTGQVIFNFS